MATVSAVLLSSAAAAATAPEDRFRDAPWTTYHGVVVASPRDGGLYRQQEDGWVEVEVPLEGAQRQIRALAAADDILWLASHEGLLEVQVTSCDVRVVNVLPVQLDEVVVTAEGLAVKAGAMRHFLPWTRVPQDNPAVLDQEGAALTTVSVEPPLGGWRSVHRLTTNREPQSSGVNHSPGVNHPSAG